VSRPHDPSHHLCGSYDSACHVPLVALGRRHRRMDCHDPRVHQSGCGTSSPKRHAQRRLRQYRTGAAPHRPPHDWTRLSDQQCRPLSPAFRRPQVRDVPRLDRLGLLHIKRPSHQIRRDRSARATVGGDGTPLAVPDSTARLWHQTSRFVPSPRHGISLERLGHAPTSITLPRLCMIALVGASRATAS
jgi:hypothetical protein